MKKLQASNSRRKPSEQEDNNSSEKNSSPLSGYTRYTNIIYQLIGTIAGAFAAGYFLDKWLQFSFPVFKLLFSFGGVVLALYLVFKELNRK